MVRTVLGDGVLQRDPPPSQRACVFDVPATLLETRQADSQLLSNTARQPQQRAAQDVSGK